MWLGYGLQSELNLENLNLSKTDFHHLGRDAQLVQHLDGFFILYLAFRAMSQFRVFPYIDWLSNVLQRTMERLLTFYMSALPFFVVMTVLLHFVSGANVEETSTVVRCMFTAIRFALGVSNSSVYYSINRTMYYIWCLIFSFVMYYFILPVSIALFLEAYEETTVELGHVTDYSHA